jgi:L-amino acid N-acyltransferase YncA
LIRQAVDSDAPGIASIYNHYVLNSVATFEEVAVSVTAMAARVDKAKQNSLPWLVAQEGNHIVGYAYASPWHARSAYRHTVEVTVYLSPTHIAKGLGAALYVELFSVLAQKPVHSVIAGIALPNPASVALHEKMGMQKVGHFVKVGYKFERWLDVAYWQLDIRAETADQSPR